MHLGTHALRRNRLVWRRRGRATAQSGFTLVEMLVVLAIIGLIVGLVGPRVVNYLSDSKVKAAQIQMENIASALELFYLDTGRYPSTAEGLTALVQKPIDATAWNGPYVKSTGVPKDAWGHDYVYRSPGQTQPFEIGSQGAEARDGGAITIRRVNDQPK